jgi:hypothetical protein
MPCAAAGFLAAAGTAGVAGVTPGVAGIAGVAARSSAKVGAEKASNNAGTTSIFKGVIAVSPFGCVGEGNCRSAMINNADTIPWLTWPSSV